ncbi:MAG: hypothetical protein CMF50_09010 [Legionellales bacterium]|nr:hypothetical protein [Legionellales bacterium]|tara:strand:- start:7531 stop:8247 length:717 start_codon:yes stop_codon:yes gene_type:complete
MMHPSHIWQRLLGFTQAEQANSVLLTLANIQKQNRPVYIFNPRTNDREKSFIQQVDYTTNQVMFSLLSSDNEYSLLYDDVKVIYTTNGINQMYLQGKLRHISRDGHVTLAVEFPNYQGGHDRRADERVVVNNHVDNHFAHLFITREYSLQGLLVDISSGGCCLAFEGNFAEGFHTGDVVNTCRIELGQHFSVEVPVQIQWHQYDHAHRHTRIGCKFLGLDSHQRRLLDLFIDNIESYR